MIIGFSSGCLHKTHDRLSPDTFELFRSRGCNAIELMISSLSEVDKFKKINATDIVGFEYVSVHAPAYKGEEISEYVRVLKVIEAKHSELFFNAVVIHPAMIDDFSFIKDINLPFFVENMDNQKETGKSVESMRDIFNKFDVPMVLDLNHCFSNDPSMKLADDFVKAFRTRINEIHLSGLDTFHDPLFKTKQDFIIDAIPGTDLPIIIESGLESVEEIGAELDYIKNYLNAKI